MITNAHRKPFNNWSGIPFIISCAKREEGGTFDSKKKKREKLQILALVFFKVSRIILHLKHATVTLCFSIACDSLFWSFLEKHVSS